MPELSLLNFYWRYWVRMAQNGMKWATYGLLGGSRHGNVNLGIKLALLGLTLRNGPAVGSLTPSWIHNCLRIALGGTSAGVHRQVFGMGTILAETRLANSLRKKGRKNTPVELVGQRLADLAQLVGARVQLILRVCAKDRLRLDSILWTIGGHHRGVGHLEYPLESYLRQELGDAGEIVSKVGRDL
jgi:hypothetical protein